MPSKTPKLLGDRVRDARPGEPAEKWIYSSFRKDHWAARKSGDLTHSEHPGTALQMSDGLYEIVLIEETVDADYPLRYGLKKWDAKHALRGVIPYTPETQAQAAGDFLEEAHIQALRSRILWTFPLAGMAPGPVQRAWEAKTALNMAVVAAASAMTQILIFMALVQAFGSPTSTSLLNRVLLYLGIDAFTRMLLIVFTGQPVGIIVLTLPYLLWDLAVHPEKRKRKKEAQLKFSLEPDEIDRRPGTGHLVIRSMLFDDLLAASQPLRFEGVVYKPLNWHREGKGLRRRWVYEFERLEDPSKVRFRELTLPRNPQRQKAVEDATRALDRAQMLGLIWGTYPAREQERLEAKFQFPAAQMTAATAGLLLAAGALEAWALKMLGAATVTYLGALYFVVESLYRLYVSKAQGRPAGSLAGWILQWFLAPPR
jgi:hypothetical protein